MSKQEKIGLGIFFFAICMLIVAEYNRKEPTNWNHSFLFDDKIPYGLYILEKEKSQLFPENVFIKKTVYEAQNKFKQKDTPSNYVTIGINSSLDKESLKVLLQYASDGNSLFIASQELPKFLADTLNLRSKIWTDLQSWLPIENPSTQGEQIETSLWDKSLRGTAYKFHKKMHPRYITHYPKNKTTILGKTKEGKINFIRVQFKKGAFYFHLIPHAFTNYYLLNQNLSYATNALSYLPKQKTYWSGSFIKDFAQPQGGLSYILSQEALRWSYYLMLGACLLYLFVGGKRKQRLIPVVVPPKNDQLNFIKTLGRLYFQQGNHGDIAHKKATYFLEYVRHHYRLPTTELNVGFQQKLAEKSGKDITLIQEICTQVAFINQQKNLSAQQLMDFNKSLNTFYEREALSVEH